MRVAVTHLFDGASLSMDTLRLKDRAGNTLSVTRLAYLVSDVALLRANGKTIPLHGEAAYLNPTEGRSTFTLSHVPPGRYAGLAFRVGVPPQTNHADPSEYPAGHPLNPVVNRLHWGWQGGYVFCALEGRYVRPGGQIGGYSYHLATDSLKMNVRVRHPFMLANGENTLPLRFDIARVFDATYPITIRPENGGDSTHSRPGDTLARRLAENLTQAFRLGDVQAASGKATPAAKVTTKAARTTPYSLSIPAGFPQPQLPADNPLTVEGIALGKRLFSEKRLSGNNTQSCANCHQAKYAFTDGGRNLSLGIDGKPGARRTMPLFNLAWSAGAYRWDGSKSRLRDQVLAPIQDTREMHQSLERTVAKLSADSGYVSGFRKAFGDSKITPERIGLAVEQYLLTLISADSKFDRALRGEAKLTDEEKRGFLLFLTESDPARGQTGGDCFHCHGGSLFTDYTFHNNGLDPGKWKDLGRYAVTHRDGDQGAFKTPSLRNVAVRAPYMHDGRFQGLEAVMDHYSEGVALSDTLDPNIAKHPDGIRLSHDDKRALVAFLKTLTDRQFGGK